MRSRRHRSRQLAYELVTYPVPPAAEVQRGVHVFAVAVPEQFVDPAASNAGSVPPSETV